MGVRWCERCGGSGWLFRWTWFVRVWRWLDNQHVNCVGKPTRACRRCKGQGLALPPRDVHGNVIRPKVSPPPPPKRDESWKARRRPTGPKPPAPAAPPRKVDRVQGSTVCQCDWCKSCRSFDCEGMGAAGALLGWLFGNLLWLQLVTPAESTLANVGQIGLVLFLDAISFLVCGHAGYWLAKLCVSAAIRRCPGAECLFVQILFQKLFRRTPS